MRRAVFFSNTASRARASTRSPRRLQPGSPRSTLGFPISRRCSPPSSSASCAETRASTPSPALADSIEERLDALAAIILTRVLTPETIGLIRVAVAEARRFPDLATSVSCMGRQRQIEAVARVFGELAASDAIGASPAFAPGKAHGDGAPVSRSCGVADADESAVRRGSGCAARRDRAARGPGGCLLSRRLRSRRQRHVKALARLRLRVIPLRRDDDARIRLDPGHMVVDGDAAGRVLGNDLERAAQPFVDDRAVKVTAPF